MSQDGGSRPLSGPQSDERGSGAAGDAPGAQRGSEGLDLRTDEIAWIAASPEVCARCPHREIFHITDGRGFPCLVDDCICQGGWGS